MKNVTTMKLSAVLLASVILLSGCGGKGNAEVEAAAAGNGTEKLKKLVIAEPLHYTGYLPLYVAQSEGYFAEEGLEVEMLQAAGGTHVTSVVSGDAWAVIGGPESNALANIGNSDPIVSVSNVVNRANVYLMAKKGQPRQAAQMRNWQPS